LLGISHALHLNGLKNLLSEYRRRKKMMQPEIVAIGEPMLEFNAEAEGALSEVERFVVGWGGDTSNFCIAAGRAGARVGYLTRLGEDEFGESFLKLWRREGIDTSRIVKDPDAFTAAYFISRKGKQHYFTYFRRDSAASRMTPGFLPKDYIASARLLHVSGISQAISPSACDTVFAAIAIAKTAGRLVSYDPNFRPKLWPLDRARAGIHETCRQADLIFPSLDDARQLTGLTAAEEIAEFYLKLGPKVVVVKLGAEGALLATADGLATFPPYKVDAIDMSGAGDTFDGAFAAAYLAGRPVEACMRFANAAAAITTTGLGCVTPVPRRAAIEALMEREPQA
jgi:2-dehydro-3-deoxygluconokinase